MNITLIEPFHTGSHAAWAEEFTRHSRHRIELLTLAGRHWKWRMHGGAVTLAQRFLESSFRPDLLLASDMLDLGLFLALTRAETAETATAVYFHENQLTYPWSPDDRDPGHQRDAHYAFINYSSALAADAVLFNSHYHLEEFNAELPGFLRSFPDQNNLATLAELAERSCVLPLGLDLQRFDRHRVDLQDGSRPPLTLWNHRWEYDKNPEEFFQALFCLQDEGYQFEVAVLGESFGKQPPIFAEAKERLGDKVVQFGYADDFATYARWLWRADLLPVTSTHDFFGASVVQAIYCNTLPLLPQRLAYPEHVPTELHEQVFYRDFEDLLERMRRQLAGKAGEPDPRLRMAALRYDWPQMIETYDDLLESIAAKRRN
ncbi:MAG: DUF3524 domain-containing protein [Desulfuromonas sp.]|nr:MAG: DUF3524 domain-containing protein [Desulfuromonas sp.]